MASNSQEGQEKFGTIGSRLGGQSAEDLKKKLFPDISSEKVSEKEKPTGNISAAQAIPIKEGAGVGVTIQKQGKEAWFQAGTEKKEAFALAQYDRPGKKEETNEELLERLSRERKEREERDKQLHVAAKETAAAASEFFQIPKREPEKNEAVKSEKAEVEGVPESAAKFQGSAAEKKKILEDLKKETDTEKRKNLWHKKNYITLEHQRNWAAFAYENAKNDEQKNKAKEDFVFAKKMLEEYVSDPDAYEKKNKWEYQALPVSPTFVEKMDTKTEEAKKETESVLPIVQPATESVEIKFSEVTQEQPSSSVAEELERSFGKRPELKEPKLEELVEIETEEASAKESDKEKNKELDRKVLPVVDNQTEYAKENGDKYTKTLEVSQEELERIQKLKESLENQEKQIEKEAEKKGYLDTIRAVGEHYKKARLTYKGALALTVLAGVSTGGAAALLGVSVGIAMRIGGGAAVFVGAEALLEKKRQEKERWWNKNPKIVAALSAGIMSGAIGKAASATGADEWLSHAWDKAFGGAEVAQSALEQAYDKIIPPPEAVVSPTIEQATPSVKVDTTAFEKAYQGAMPASEIVAETVGETIHTVVSGENLHNIIADMKDLSELEGGKKENAIANIIAYIQKNPAEYGVVSGDVNHLAVGDHVDMEKIRAMLGETKIGGESILEHAKHLTPEQITSIEQIKPSNDGIIKNLDVLDKTISELKESQAGTAKLMSEFDAIGHPSALDLSDKGIASMSATEDLPSTIQRNLENVFGVGERELGDTEWEGLQGKDAEDFLDDFSLDTDSPEEKLREYLGKIIDDTDIKPNEEETILEYLKRAGGTKI